MRPAWKWKTRILLGGALAALLAGALPLEAQRGRRGGGFRGQGPNRAEMEQRIRQRMGEMMRERLGLTDEQAAGLGEIVQGFEQQRRDLFRQEQAVRRRVEALVLEGGDGDEEGRELLARMLELRRSEADLYAAEQEALLEILSPVQVLRLQSLRDQLGQQIRRFRGGWDGPPGGDPGAVRFPRGV